MSCNARGRDGEPIPSEPVPSGDRGQPGRVATTPRFALQSLVAQAVGGDHDVQGFVLDHALPAPGVLRLPKEGFTPLVGPVATGEHGDVPLVFNTRVVTIGGGGTANVDDGGAAGVHARVLRLRGIFALEPVGNAVPIRIDGRVVTALAPLHNGNRLEVGDAVFRFSVVPLAPDETTPAEEIAGAFPAGVPGTTAEGVRPTFWQMVYAAVNWAFLRPRARADVAVASLIGGGGVPYHVLKDPSKGTYLKLSTAEYAVWELMDGQRTIKDIAVTLFMEKGILAPELVSETVGRLMSGGFTAYHWTALYTRLAQRLARVSSRARLLAIAGRLVHTEVPVPHVDRPLAWLYRHGGRLFFTRAANIVMTVLLLTGLSAFAADLLGGAQDFNAGDRPLLGVLVLVVLFSVTVAVHETAHGLAVKNYGGEVRRGGAILTAGVPFTFFADTTDIWMYPKGARLRVVWAGPYTTLIVAGLCAMAALLLPRGNVGSLAILAAGVLYLSALFNLNPLVNNDGYQMLSDALDIPGLSAKALAFTRQQLLGRLRKAVRGGAGLSREEMIFAVYGSIASAWSFLVLGALAALWFWRLGGWVQTTWNGAGLPGRIVLAAVIVAVLATPLVFPVMLLRQSAARAWVRLRGLSASVRDRQQREAERLLSRLPLASVIPPAEVRAAAGAMALRRFVAGTEIIRQGAPGDAFYVIRTGRAEVLQQQEAARVLLTELGSGDAFGELALLHDTPRAATVRAIGTLEAFVLDRRAFTRWVRPHVMVRAYLESIARMREVLRQTALLRHFTDNQLDLIAARLTTEDYAPGEVIVREGDPGDSFFMLRQGQVVVTARRADGEDEAVATFDEGGYFGETALLLATTRTATVAAVTPVTVWRLSRADFSDVLVQSLRLRPATFAA